MKYRSSISVLTSLLLIVFILSGCRPEPITIAISKGKPEQYYGAYAEWLKHFHANTTVIDMYHIPLDSALLIIETCDGLLVSGGPDVHPTWYKKPQDTSLCETIDTKRDTLEMNLIKKALALKIPVLGICRGEQIFNVSQGGSLYADIPTLLGTDVKHRNNEGGYECFHEVKLVNKSYLNPGKEEIIHTSNSAHHQGINVIGNGLRPIAYTQDGLVEAIEWEQPEGKSFLLAVQWHPERLEYDQYLSKTIATTYLNEVKKFSKKKNQK